MKVFGGVQVKLYIEKISYLKDQNFKTPSKKTLNYPF